MKIETLLTPDQLLDLELYGKVRTVVKQSQPADGTTTRDALTEQLMAQCPRPSKPVTLPPLVSFQAKVSMDTAARYGTAWKVGGHGKLLTNRRIAELQREGKYGSALKLPPLDNARPCIDCGSKVNTIYRTYDYLPKSGVYCSACRLVYREVRDKDLAMRKAEREAFKAEFERRMEDYK